MGNEFHLRFMICTQIYCTYTHMPQPASRANNLYCLNNVDSNDDHLRLITKVQSQFTIFLKLFPFISCLVHVSQILYPVSKFFNILLNFQNHSNLPKKFQIHQIQNYFATKSSSAIIIHSKNYKNVKNGIVKSINILI